MRIAIVDDELKNREIVKNHLERFTKENNSVFEIDCFSDGDEITENYVPKYDIILMDIEMPRIDGMKAAKYIRKLDSDVVIIFITNHLKYAQQGYSVNALGYLVKPFTYFAFSQELFKAIRLVSLRSDTHVFITVNGESFRLSAREITYVESIKHKLIIHRVSKDDISIFESLKSFEKRVGKGFVRCNSCYLVNLRHVVGIKENCAIIGNDKLQISRPKKKAFVEALAGYCGGITDD